mmetsp:Transcript_15467/g.38082  ORF Transcript_15467/g.38082 Transcript_15467/m.38082 type:complete len:200 (-) Transcript_15467:1450-2049(-)
MYLLSARSPARRCRTNISVSGRMPPGALPPFRSAAASGLTPRKPLTNPGSASSIAFSSLNSLETSHRVLVVLMAIPTTTCSVALEKRRTVFALHSSTSRAFFASAAPPNSRVSWYIRPARSSIARQAICSSHSTPSQPPPPGPSRIARTCSPAWASSVISARSRRARSSRWRRNSSPHSPCGCLVRKRQRSFVGRTAEK